MSYRMIEAARRLMCDKFSVLCTLAELNAKQLREDERMNKYKLNELLAECTPENRHEEFDWEGKRMSKSSEKLDAILKGIIKQYDLSSEKMDDDYTLRENEINQLYELISKNGIRKEYDLVADFHTKMGQPVADKPTEMKFARREQRFNYMAEELDEFIHAKTVVDQADAMIDLIYLAVGTMVELGVKPEALFEIVHNANMSKIWPDGKAKLNPQTGKVIKPPTFVRPEPLLEAEIERQLKEAK